MQQWPCRAVRIVGSSRTKANKTPQRGLVELVVLAMLFLSFGCASQTDASDPAGDDEEGEVVQPEAIAPAEVDTVEILDDERSLERRIEDASIAARVRMALVDARDLRAFDFEPIVENGRVELRGEVNTREQRSRAEVVVREVNGVRDIANQVVALQEPVLADAGDEESSADETASGSEADTSVDEPTSATDEETASAGESASAAEETTPQPSEEVYHTVQSGESLWTISRRHGVSIEQIRRLNSLQSNSIRPGQRLRVK